MREHIAAELSVRLAAIEAAAADPTTQRTVRWLRLRAENGPAAALELVAAEAFALSDELCFATVSDGDASGFYGAASAAVDLFDFCVSARLVAGR